MKVQPLFDDGRTFTLTYIVYDEHSGDAAIIDPVLDLDTTPWCTFTDSIEKSAPRLLFPSLQTNINAGALPGTEANQVSYLKIPLNIL